MTSEISNVLQFRQAVRPSDVESVRRMVTATGKFHDEEIAIAVELVQERLAKGVASGYEFLFADTVHTQPGESSVPRSLGFACYGRIPCTQSSFDLYWIAVDPAEQGRGVGRQLLQAVECQLLQSGCMQLYADTSGRADYKETRAFYRAVDFEVATVLKDFYAVGDDKVIFLKRLLADAGD